MIELGINSNLTQFDRRSYCKSLLTVHKLMRWEFDFAHWRLFSCVIKYPETGSVKEFGNEDNKLKWLMNVVDFSLAILYYMMNNSDCKRKI